MVPGVSGWERDVDLWAAVASVPVEPLVSDIRHDSVHDLRMLASEVLSLAGVHINVVQPDDFPLLLWRRLKTVTLQRPIRIRIRIRITLSNLSLPNSD